MAKKISTPAILTAVIGAILGLFAFNYGTQIADASAANGDIPKVTVSDGSLKVDGAGFSESTGSAWTTLITKYRNFIVGVSGIAAVTMVVIFILQFIKLGASAGNPQARSQALTGVLWSGIAAAGLGAVSLIVGLFYRSIN